MELVEGENLKTRVRREGALAPEEAARICAQVGARWRYAQAQGVVHRDIKAQNVLLTRDGAVKLADFGIARSIESDGQPGITRTDMLIGSADYLSPEQADGRPVDARTDVYSLGIVLYECLTGELPFRGDGFVAVAMKHCSEPMPDPRAANPAVPDWLAAVTMRAAAKDPAHRYPDAAAWSSRWRRAPTGARPSCRGGGDRPAAARGGHGPPPAPAAAAGCSGARARGRRRRRRDRGVRAPRADVRRRAAQTAAAALAAFAAVRDYDPRARTRAERPDLDAAATTATPRPPGTRRTTSSPPSSGPQGRRRPGHAPRRARHRHRDDRHLAHARGALPGARASTGAAGAPALAEGDFTGGRQVVPLATAQPAEAYVLWITMLVAGRSEPVLGGRRGGTAEGRAEQHLTMTVVSFEESLGDLEGRLAAQGGRGRRLSPRSRAAYLKDARRVAGWLAEQGVAGPAAVTPSAIEAAFRGLGWSPASRARATTALREWLAPYHPPSRSPADLIDRPRAAPPPVPRLSQRDAAALVDGAAGRPGAAGPVAEALALRDRALMEVLYGSGLRRQEACDLVLAGLDFEHEALRGWWARAAAPGPCRSPSRRSRRCARGCGGRPRLVAGGRPWRRPGPRCSSRAPGAPSTARPSTASSRASCARPGGPAGRTCCATPPAPTCWRGPAAATGAHLRVVQEVLGHASLATTQRYTGVTTKSMQAALRRGHPRG